VDEEYCNQLTPPDLSKSKTAQGETMNIQQTNTRQQNQIFGRLEGLVEAYGKTDSEWTPEQRYRIEELYMLLDSRFIVGTFSNGFPSEQNFLKEVGAELFNNGHVEI